jgi:hypothetical protein
MDTLLMAQQLQNITVQAPGFAGINSQDSPLTLDQSFASIASNCVIDQYGRIGARKGYKTITTNSTPVDGSRGIEKVHEYVKRDGTKVVFSAGNNKIFTGTTTLAPVTLPTDYTITANDWKIVTFNNDVFFFQRNHAALQYDSSAQSGNATLILAEDSNHSAPEANEVIAAYGRLWAADLSGNKHTVYFSDLLIGNKWHGGSSGSLNLTNVFPTGNDEIVALAAHNGFLVIFCKRSIIVYEGAELPSADPVVFKLNDTVEGVGCIARDSIQHTGTDILFLSEDGVRSFSRTVQEKSMPMRDLSKNVRTDLTSLIGQQTNPIQSVYSADEAFYLLIFPDSNTVYCFDTRSSLPDGSLRVTTWSGMGVRTASVLQDKSIYLGNSDGIAEYTGYLDGSSTYILMYYSNPLNFGNSTNLKFLKKFKLTVIGNSSSNTTLVWGYDYTNSYNKKVFTPSGTNSSIAEFNIAKFGRKEDIDDDNNGVPDEPNYEVFEFTEGTDIQRPNINTSGSGSVVTIGIESTVNGAPYSIQQIDVHALLGRLI